jgi:hypothetical protein
VTQATSPLCSTEFLASLISNILATQEETMLASPHGFFLPSMGVRNFAFRRNWK